MVVDFYGNRQVGRKLVVILCQLSQKIRGDGLKAIFSLALTLLMVRNALVILAKMDDGTSYRCGSFDQE
jgi:hypothetical protein